MTCFVFGEVVKAVFILVNHISGKTVFSYILVKYLLGEQPMCFLKAVINDEVDS